MKIRVTATGNYDTTNEYKVCLIKEGTELQVKSQINEGIRGSFYLCEFGGRVATIEKENAQIIDTDTILN